MINPSSKGAAAAIFFTGVAAIAYTILDVQRSMRANDVAPSAGQLDQLEHMIEHSRKRAGKQ